MLSAVKIISYFTKTYHACRFDKALQKQKQKLRIKLGY